MHRGYQNLTTPPMALINASSDFKVLLHPTWSSSIILPEGPYSSLLPSINYKKLLRNQKQSILLLSGLFVEQFASCDQGS